MYLVKLQSRRINRMWIGSRGGQEMLKIKDNVNLKELEKYRV